VQSATAPAPPQYDEGPLLDIGVDGLRFPDWAEEFGWRATGSRVDHIGGRRAVTVFYRLRDRRVAYTILSGPELHVPHAFQPAVRNGVLIRHLLIGGRTIVTWERAGHTCVLTGQRVGLERMRRLAAWKSHGEIRY
jgi:hypothetical protein